VETGTDGRVKTTTERITNGAFLARSRPTKESPLERAIVELGIDEHYRCFDSTPSIRDSRGEAESKVIETTVNPIKPQDDCGQVKSGRLALQGMLQTFIYEHRYPESIEYDWNGKSSRKLSAKILSNFKWT